MRHVAVAALGIALVSAVPGVKAADPAPTPHEVKIDAKTKQAIGKALDWLKARQSRDGAWGKTAVTSFALLAFLANGHVPNEGEYGPEVAMAVRYLIAGARDDGYLVHPKHDGNMYCHGMATLALSQVFGMTADDDVKKVLMRAVTLIVKSQNHEGGWRYSPAPNDADISVTIMMVMALRGAKDSGMNVPNGTLTKAVAYINKCRDVRSGGYKYQPNSGEPGYARTAAGVCVLQLSGDYEAKDIAKAVKYMDSTGDDKNYYWYGHYYSAHAMHQVGGKAWVEYYERMTSRLLATQRPSGEWLEPMEQHHGAEYQTAVAVLILSVPANYLPIYQR
ncbi:MAG: prenyltransferase/squalene oxidase repeat-containing protein [Fimbriiglobus sp.]